MIEQTRQPMKVLSLFSGVGGFDLGLEAAGMETVFQCEWDKHCQTILQRHWPTVPKWDDVSTLTAAHILSVTPVIDVVAWGSPCQDLSVAGKRAGLGGERSGLFHQGIRIIKEMRNLTNGKYPRLSIWENVAGALSSNQGADFGQILYEMDEAGACFSEWRLLDAQYFGVPQRRRRVFLISVFDPATAERCPNPLLPVSEGVQWHPATSTTTRQEPAGETATGFGGGSQWWNGAQVADTLTATSDAQRMPDKNRLQVIVGTLAARDYKGVGNQYVDEGKLVVESEGFTGSSFAQYTEGVGTLRSNGGDLAGGSETLLVEPFVKSRRAQSTTDHETWVEAEVNPTINQFDAGDIRTTTVVVGSLLGRVPGTNHEGIRDGQLILEPEPIVFENSYRDAARIAEDGVTQTLSAKMGTGGGNTPMVAIPIQDGREIEKQQNGLGVAESGAPAYTLDQTGAQAVAYSIREDAKANTFSATEMDRANALNSLRPSPQSHHAQMFIAEPTMSVRRLTPLECERLMGWPDNWTAGQSDTHRYKQCGNGVASPVAQWIAQQLINL